MYQSHTFLRATSERASSMEAERVVNQHDVGAATKHGTADAG